MPMILPQILHQADASISLAASHMVISSKLLLYIQCFWLFYILIIMRSVIQLLFLFFWRLPYAVRHSIFYTVSTAHMDL